MANINDYILWRGDLSIDASPFNELDSMIMARFSYLPFDKIKISKEETIETIAKKMEKLAKDDFNWDGDDLLISLLGKSLRFKDMIISDIKQSTIKTIEQQFASVTIHLSKKEMYISYIGTDSTVTGWKEDFNMSFSDSVPCQIEGKKYLNSIALKYPNKRIRLGGHSKGGNVGIYAGLSVSDDIKRRIIKIDNFDGPGFPKTQIEKYQNKRLTNRIENFYPQDSIIGRFMNSIGSSVIVKSNAKGFLEHDIYTWEVMGKSLIYLENAKDNSIVLNNTVTKWLDETTTKERKIFIDSIFDLLYSTECDKFKDIMSNIPGSLSKMIKKYGEISDEEKDTIFGMLKMFVKYYLKERFQNEKLKFTETINRWRNKEITKESK